MTPLRRTAATPGPENVEQILNELANLKIEDRPVLGDRKNIDNAIQQAKADAKKPAREVIVITDSTDAGDLTKQNQKQTQAQNHIILPAGYGGTRIPKAIQLNKLTTTVSEATNNAAIAGVVTDFVVLLKSNRSRTLTKEGFAFLDALYKQLADPSVYVVPLRTSRNNTDKDSEQHQQQQGVGGAAQDARRVKLDVLAALRREVETATGNRALAKMVADFGAVTNKSGGRTVTKDGFAFLEGLAARLKATQ